MTCGHAVDGLWGSGAAFRERATAALARALAGSPRRASRSGALGAEASVMPERHASAKERRSSRGYWAGDLARICPCWLVSTKKSRIPVWARRGFVRVGNSAVETEPCFVVVSPGEQIGGSAAMNAPGGSLRGGSLRAAGQRPELGQREAGSDVRAGQACRHRDRGSRGERRASAGSRVAGHRGAAHRQRARLPDSWRLPPPGSSAGPPRGRDA